MEGGNAKAAKPSFPVTKGIAIAYLCEFYRLITLGNGSGFAEIYYLHKSGTETGTATVLTMLQYMGKRIAIMLLGGAGFAVLLCGKDTRTLCKEYAVFMAVGCAVSFAVIALFLCIVLSQKVTNVIIWSMDWIGRKSPSWETRLGKWKGQLVLLNESGKDVLAQKSKIPHVILLQITKLMLFYSIPAYLLHGKIQIYGTPPDWMTGIFLMAVVYMLSGVIPAPSGVGSLEFVFLLFFSEFTGAQTAVPAILVFRFVTWIIPFLIGGMVKVRLRILC